VRQVTGERMTVGLVGAGRWGRKLATAFAKLCEVSAICHRGRPNTRLWIEKEFPGAMATDRLSDLLEDDTIDAIVIATPISTHAEIATMALNAGKHTFVEKPIASSALEGTALVSLADSKGLALFVGHVFVYDPVFDELKRITADDPITRVKTNWHKYGTFDEDLIWNLMSHELAIGIGLFERHPDSGRILYERGFVSESDAVAATFSFGSDARNLLVEIDRCATLTAKSLTVITDSGAIFTWSGNMLYECKTSGLNLIFTRPDVQPLEREIASFERQVKLGERPLTDGEFGLEVVSAVELLRS
jgi:predicted dehydrogenase